MTSRRRIRDKDRRLTLIWCDHEKDWFWSYPNRDGKHAGAALMRALADPALTAYLRHMGYDPSTICLTIDPVKKPLDIG